MHPGTRTPSVAMGRLGRIAVVLSYSGDGGVERMMNSLLAGLVEAGHAVDVLVLKRRGGHFAGIPPGCRVLPLRGGHALMAVPALVRYLRRERPLVLLAAKDHAGRAALRARAWARVPTRVVLRIGNTLAPKVAGRSPLRRWLRYLPVRRLYPLADAIIAVSEGVADDVVATSGVDRRRVYVVRNPVITREIDRQAQARPRHRWIDNGGVPLVLAVGRLTRQKDFPTLLRAFARLRERRPAHLVVLGEGDDRAGLEQLAARLGIGEAVDFPGFVDNPYAWMAHADVYALSSRWEGSPNALTEALYLGVPVVATDCPSGPREILDGGRVAPLVPVGDDTALADAMLETLAAPPRREALRAAVIEYTRERSTARYLEVLETTARSERC